MWKKFQNVKGKNTYPWSYSSPLTTEHGSEQAPTFGIHLEGRKPSSTGESKQYVVSCWSHFFFLRLFLSLGDSSRVWVLRQFSEIQTMYAVSGEPISIVFWEEIKHLFVICFSVCLWLQHIVGAYGLLGTVVTHTSSEFYSELQDWMYTQRVSLSYSKWLEIVCQ